MGSSLSPLLLVLELELAFELKEELFEPAPEPTLNPMFLLAMMIEVRKQI